MICLHILVCLLVILLSQSGFTRHHQPIMARVVMGIYLNEFGEKFKVYYINKREITFEAPSHRLSYWLYYIPKRSIWFLHRWQSYHFITPSPGSTTQGMDGAPL